MIEIDHVACLAMNRGLHTDNLQFNVSFTGLKTEISYEITLGTVVRTNLFPFQLYY